MKGEKALSSKDLIMQNAMMICPKIVGAEAGDLYILKMENASIIRTNCKELLVQVRSCALFDEANEEYAQVLISEIEIFKQCFIECVSLL